MDFFILNLTTENIDYTKLTYDSEQQTYFVALSGYLPTTKTNVITQGELLEEKFQNYCLKQNSNFGITNLGVLYRYNTLQ